MMVIDTCVVVAIGAGGAGVMIGGLIVMLIYDAALRRSVRKPIETISPFNGGRSDD